MVSAQQGVFSFGDLVFFSNFDSGNLAAVERRPNNWVTPNQFELWVGADASQLGHTAYRVWFYFGVRGMTKGSTIRMSIVNFSGMRSLFNNRYKIVWATQPSRDQWFKLSSDISYDPLPGNNARISWDFDPQGDSLTHYFAFAYPYSLDKLDRTLTSLTAILPQNTYFHREVLTYSVERRPVEVITITDRGNVRGEEEEGVPGLFPTGGGRALR